MGKTNIIVVGNGMVGYKFCEKLIKKCGTEQFNLTVFGEEPRPAYDRVHLSEYFADKDADRLSMAPRSWYEENKITLITNERVTDIHRSSKEITTISDKKYTYDYLVLATGSSAFVPPIKGVEKDGVFVYRTIEDLDATMNYVAKLKSEGTQKKAAILGGGLLGLEAAKALIDMGLETSVVEFAPRLMPRQLNGDASKSLQTKLEALGIEILLSKATQQITGDKFMTGMQFSEDETVPFDMLLVSAGIRPRDELAKTCDLEVGTRGGIMVSNDMKTSDPNIYAIGECALLNNMIYGFVAPGYDMAEVALNQILGEESLMPEEIDMSTKLKLSGIDVASFGNALNEGEEGVEIVYENAFEGVYKSIVVSKDGKALLGGIMVGDADDYNMLHQIYMNGMAIPENPEKLIIKSTGGDDDAFGGVESLPDSAIICSCENVDKGTICCSVKDDGNTDVKSLVAATKAGTGCGGCMPMVKDLLNDTLKGMGVAVKNTICEHFDYSRQELFDLVKVKGYTTFQEVVQALGKGTGCELCKPAVSSILASLNNHTVVTEETALDTNDRYLANIQRGGTYSVVPRVPGGEITPEKLIVIGEVAKKWDLYVKITGGQRIDLLGAKLNDLPDIWEALIEAGMETGQAYGKSVRTVKSCVGSTWCRYGVQDSVSMAIQIENRYKGLRSPHKLKFAVSGCTRECAEAQNKDIGVIATDKGWNLFVCGNGGSKPQHGPLFATDISDEELIKYIDRILMFYIKTAEPLQRTATWFNKLEGGLDYLKDVVINDSLGICEDLEAMMQHQVDTYKCEWKSVVETPELRAKFKQFVNVEDTKSNLEFVDSRGMKVPEPWS